MTMYTETGVDVCGSQTRKACEIQLPRPCPQNADSQEPAFLTSFLADSDTSNQATLL